MSFFWQRTSPAKCQLIGTIFVTKNHVFVSFTKVSTFTSLVTGMGSSRPDLSLSLAEVAGATL